MLFNKQVTEERISEVSSKYNELVGDWMPAQTNGFELKKEVGSWEKVDISEFKTYTWEESWGNMPEKAIEYLQSLPEWDAELFKKITELDVETCDHKAEYNYCPHCGKKL